MEQAGWGAKKFLIDGYPRNEDNVQGWTSIMGDSAEIARVLHLDVDVGAMTDRIMERAKTGERNDDNLETLKKRSAQFEKEQLPVIQQYEKRGLVSTINCNQEVDKVYADVTQVVGPFLKAGSGQKLAKPGPNCLREGEFFIMVDNAGHQKVLQATKRKINHSKAQVDLEQVIGCEWGTVFAVRDRQTGDLQEVTEPQSTLTADFLTGIDGDDADAEMEDGAAEESKDNRNIVDNNVA